MQQFFSEENPVFAALSFLADLVIVSLLWLVCSLPVVTAGASASALYYAVTKSIRHKRGYAWREYFRGLKTCIRQSTLVWVIYALLMVLLTFDIRIMKTSEGHFAVFLQFAFTVCMICLTAAVIYALSYIARFTLNFRGVVKNAVLLSVKHLPTTLLVLLTVLCGAGAVYLIPLSMLIVPAIAALVISMLLERVFIRYMTQEDRELEEIRNHPEQYEYINRKGDL